MRQWRLPVLGHQAGEGLALGQERAREQLRRGKATAELRGCRGGDEQHPRQHQGTPTVRIGTGPPKASKGVALVAWPWLCARARTSGLPEPRRGRALGTAALGQGRRRRFAGYGSAA